MEGSSGGGNAGHQEVSSSLGPCQRGDSEIPHPPKHIIVTHVRGDTEKTAKRVLGELTSEFEGTKGWWRREGPRGKQEKQRGTQPRAALPSLGHL